MNVVFRVAKVSPRHEQHVQSINKYSNFKENSRFSDDGYGVDYAENSAIKSRERKKKTRYLIGVSVLIR